MLRIILIFILFISFSCKESLDIRKESNYVNASKTTNWDTPVGKSPQVEWLEESMREQNPEISPVVKKIGGDTRSSTDRIKKLARFCKLAYFNGELPFNDQDYEALFENIIGFCNRKTKSIGDDLSSVSKILEALRSIRVKEIIILSDDKDSFSDKFLVEILNFFCLNFYDTYYKIKKLPPEDNTKDSQFTQLQNKALTLTARDDLIYIREVSQNNISDAFKGRKLKNFLSKTTTHINNLNIDKVSEEEIKDYIKVMLFFYDQFIKDMLAFQALFIGDSWKKNMDNEVLNIVSKYSYRGPEGIYPYAFEARKNAFFEIIQFMISKFEEYQNALLIELSFLKRNR